MPEVIDISSDSEDDVAESVGAEVHNADGLGAGAEVHGVEVEGVAGEVHGVQAEVVAGELDGVEVEVLGAEVHGAHVVGAQVVDPAPNGAVVGHLWFEKKITKSQATARQTLSLPRHFVKHFLNEEWDTLVLHSPDNMNYNCKLLWRSRNDHECHLGGEWYQFVNDMQLRRGGKVEFQTIEEGINFVITWVVRGRQH